MESTHANGGSGGTRTHESLATPTCVRDRLLIWPDRFHIHGVASPARFERATFAIGTRCSAPLSYGDTETTAQRPQGSGARSRPAYVVSTAGVEPATSGFVDRHLSIRSRRHGSLTAPSMAPLRPHGDVSAVDGVRTRILRRDGPALDQLSYDSMCAPWGRVASAPMTMSVQLSMCWCPGLACPARSRLGRCRTPGRRCWRPRRHRGASPWIERAHDVVRA